MFVGDGSSYRVKLKPRPGELPSGIGHPKDEGVSPWLLPLPVSILKGQAYVNDGTTGFIKQKPVPSSVPEMVEEDSDVVCIPPEGLGISSNPVSPVAPHSTVVITSAWNNFTTGPTPTYQWKLGNVDLPESGQFSGTQTTVLTITDFTAANGGRYQSFAMGRCGTVEQNILMST